MKTPVTRLDYCQDLLVSQINYTRTNLANQCEPCRHDAITRYLRGEKSTPRLLWDKVRAPVVGHEHGYVVFDDTVLDKHASWAIERVRHLYSGNAQAVIKGMGVVIGVYVQPDLDQCWLLDDRL